MQITIKDFIKFRDFIYNRCGIFFETKKIYFVKKRLISRMESLGIGDINVYLNLLHHRDGDDREFQALINLLTTNETYFFREFDQLATFGEHCLVEISDQKEAKDDRNIRIWSAGCSTGEEPYTLAIILREILEDLDLWQVKVYGTDIDTNVLARCRKGIYSPRSVKDVPDEYLATYFSSQGKNFQIKPQIKEIVSFKQVNLMDKLSMLQMRRMDFIFCRNVLIYFDEESRREVAGWFYDALLPGGYVFLGHSESMSRISTAFRIKKMGGMIVYQKPL
jgi:chemotaxis protein methyltransferase CheR